MKSGYDRPPPTAYLESVPIDALFVMVNGEKQDPENQITHTKIERRISNNGTLEV